jgi:uncharacterized protein (DUF4415 family)
VKLMPESEGDMKTTSTDRARPECPLTEAQVAQLKALEGRSPDAADIPPALESNWASAVRGKHHAAMQGMITVRLDAEVLGWLCRKGPAYLTEINRILHERMEAEAAG